MGKAQKVYIYVKMRESKLRFFIHWLLRNARSMRIYVRVKIKKKMQRHFIMNPLKYFFLGVTDISRGSFTEIDPKYTF